MTFVFWEEMWNESKEEETVVDSTDKSSYIS